MYVLSKHNHKRKNNACVTREIIQLRIKTKFRCHKRQVDRRDISLLSMSMKKTLSTAKQYLFSVKMCNFMKSAPRKFWSYLSPPRQGSTHLLVDNKIIMKDTYMASLFNQFFRSVFLRGVVTRLVL